MTHQPVFAGRKCRIRHLDLRKELGIPEACRFLEATIAMAFKLPLEELRAGTRRRAPVALARQVAMYVAHVGLGMSLTEVGEQFGRDRTTAAHACRVVEEHRDDPRFDRLLAVIELATANWQKMITSEFWGNGR